MCVHVFMCVHSLTLRFRVISEKCDGVFGLPPLLHCLFSGVMFFIKRVSLKDDIVILFWCTVVEFNLCFLSFLWYHSLKCWFPFKRLTGYQNDWSGKMRFWCGVSPFHECFLNDDLALLWSSGDVVNLFCWFIILSLWGSCFFTLCFD